MDKKLKSEIGSTGDLCSYLKEKAKNHNYYKYYSNLEWIESTFLKDQALYLSTGIHWNDTSDYGRFNPESSDVVRFGMCFSYSKSESVPMWMLYGGLDRKGAMIDLSRNYIEWVLSKTNTIELGKFASGEFKGLISLDSKSFEIDIQDILYYGDSIKERCIDSFYVRRSDEVADQVNRRIVNDDSVIRKRLGWSYENETRIIVSLKKELIKNLDGYLELLVRISTKDYKPENSFTDRITLAPNYSGEEREYKKSNLSNELEWDLCKSTCVNQCRFDKTKTCSNCRIM